MFRSLHMKLVLIMVLLIVSLMTVVGAFLINSVSAFYINDFYAQMNDAFSDNTQFVRDLLLTTEGEEDGALMIGEVLDANKGSLGVDGRNRNYYVLNGTTGAYLTGSDDAGGQAITMTPNLIDALSRDDGAVASGSDITADYMDVAVPITRGGVRYIIYILDQRETVEQLSSQLFLLILEAAVFGLVISVLLSLLLAKTMVTPIARLTAGAERIAGGDFSHKPEVSSQDEIGVLTTTFNHMAHRLEDTLQTVENERNKLNTLFLHMTDGVVAFARDGAVIHSNPAAEQMLGRPASPQSGAVYDDLFGDIAPLSAVLEMADNGYVDETRIVAHRTLDILLAPFDRGTQAGVLAVLHDVTEHHRTEELRREFVANVSHELRTPLTNIRSYAETLADNPDLPPDRAENFLGVILSESDRMTHIVQDLLTLSRFDSGHSPLHLSQFPFGDAIQDLCHAVYLECRRHRHTLDLALPPDLPSVTGDRERVVQVMMNILSNAIKYTPDGGHIAVTAGHTQDRVWMEVADNGIGIPKADRPRIFERFYRVDKARSRESGGTGLGLSIAAEIVRQHGGSLALVDRPGPGLTVRLELLREGPCHE